MVPQKNNARRERDNEAYCREARVNLQQQTDRRQKTEHGYCLVRVRTDKQNNQHMMQL